MNNEDYTRTARFKALAPGLAWLPRFIRDKLTPALVGSALTFLFGALAYFFNSPQKDIARVQESVTELKQAVDQVLTLSQHNETTQADLRRQVADMAKQFDLEQARWVRIDTVAELPPHARKVYKATK